MFLEVIAKYAQYMSSDMQEKNKWLGSQKAYAEARCETGKGQKEQVMPCKEELNDIM